MWCEPYLVYRKSGNFRVTATRKYFNIENLSTCKQAYIMYHSVSEFIDNTARLLLLSADSCNDACIHSYCIYKSVGAS